MGEHGSGIRVVARVLIQNDAGELLLCRGRSGKDWVAPGGTLELGETLAQAAAREALEEVGLEVAVGALAYVNEFRPAHRAEQVVELCFRARALREAPAAAADRAVAAGEPDRPWRRWFIQDPDGPRRDVRWFTREQVAAESDPVYPKVLRERFWTEQTAATDPYLGSEQAK